MTALHTQGRWGPGRAQVAGAEGGRACVAVGARDGGGGCSGAGRAEHRATDAQRGHKPPGGGLRAAPAPEDRARLAEKEGRWGN